jgi:hypothetical protein
MLFYLHLKTVSQKTQVMFPVLQVSKVKNLSDVGHYFLLVLNIRNARFEVLDSMRTLEDTSLRTCCDKLMEAIKKLWSEYYPDSKVQIQNYEAISIAVPQQNNKYTPFFSQIVVYVSAYRKTGSVYRTKHSDMSFFVVFCSHDCGFHMLMHAEHWDGRAACNFSHKDMPNIRKLLTHKWFTHEENETKWRHKFLPRQ